VGAPATGRRHRNAGTVRDRQTTLAVTVTDHCGEIEHHPAIAPDAIGVQLMVWRIGRDAAEIDHGGEDRREAGSPDEPFVGIFSTAGEAIP